MKRSRNSSSTPAARAWRPQPQGFSEDEDEDERESPSQPVSAPTAELFYGGETSEELEANGAAIVRNIASFLTLSDAASLASGAFVPPSASSHSHVVAAAQRHSSVVPAPEDPDTGMIRNDSWAVGIDLDHHMEGSSSRSCGRWSAIETPLTPPHMQVSPGATPLERGGGDNIDGDMYKAYGSDESSDDMKEILRVHTRKWAQEKLTMAIFSHPGSIRSFCLDAYSAAQQIREKQEQEMAMIQAAACPDEEDGNVDPETQVYPKFSGQHKAHPHEQKRREPPLQHLLHNWIDLLIFDNIPLSIVLDLFQAAGDVSLEATWASLKLTHRSVDALISALAQAVAAVWETITHIVFHHHPGRWLEAIKQSNAMGVTSGALKSGFQSVAHSVGSASNLAVIQRWSAVNLSSRAATGVGEPSLIHLGPASSHSNQNQQRLLDRLSAINDASRVLAYQEVRDDTGGLTQKELSRARRMMHYSVSLRPFVVTVALRPDSQQAVRDDVAEMRSVASVDGSEGHGDDEEGSLFMCTPQSFPPTPNERQMVMISKSRKSNDTVFKTRDKLRLHSAVHSEDEKTRAMAKALEDAESLATFDDNPAHENDIELSCGNNIATKIGSTMYYSNTRSKVPLWRNSYVYFEITVLPHVGSNPPIAIPTLSIGLSSEEAMPPNTLVGAMQGSVGLCTTGQILLAGQWCSPVQGQAANLNAAYRYSDGSTVGCLVCLDDDTAFETWDGNMITSGVTFSVNGHVVPPFAPASTLNNIGLGNGNSNDDSHSTASSASSSSSTASSVEEPRAAATVNLVVSAAEDVYPTVTLQSAATAVLCRFSAEDVLASSRDMIGAPDGDVPIYAVDGSVLHL